MIPFRLSAIRRRRGLSLVEMLIVVSLFTVVGAFLTAITMATARQSAYSLSMIPSETGTFRAIERSRLEILPAARASIAITDNGRTITMRNPARNTTSRLEFDGGSLFLTRDIDTPGRTLVARNVTGTFAFEQGAGAGRIRVEARSASRGPRNTRIVNSHSDVFAVRN